MSEPVVVVGWGVAGLAAVAGARNRGARVRLLDPSVGASVLGGGAVDDQPWESLEQAAALLGVPLLVGECEPSVRQFVDALGLWTLPAGGQPPCRLATQAGRIRSARGHDRALLDLSTLPAGSRVVVPRVPRPDWDAPALARALTEQDYARANGIRFEPVDAELIRLTEEQHLDAVSFAARQDEVARQQGLGRALGDVVSRERAVGREVNAVLLGPWLGARASCAEAVSAQAAVPVGEILCSLATAAGARFEAARDRLLRDWHIECEGCRVTRIETAAAGLRLEAAGLEGPLEPAAVVLATGGLVGGGIRYAPPEIGALPAEPAAARTAFSLSFNAPVELQAGGETIEITSSLHGPTLDETAWPTGSAPGLLEQIGIACHGVRAGSRIFVAGDARADCPRTKLEAVRSGLAAGEAAAVEAGSDL